MTALAMSERDLQTAVIELARICGWIVGHFHDSRRQVGGRLVGDADAAGFPDLVMVRDRLIFAELKSEKGRVKPEQQAWLDALANATRTLRDPSAEAVRLPDGGVIPSGVEVHVWRPSDWPEIERTLR